MDRALRSALAEGPLSAAEALLGAVLSRASVDGSVAVRVTEVEAYGGADDPGSHGFRGPTPRNATMFGPAGHLYAYRIYGMHTCLNVVAGAPGTSAAVLLRAGVVVGGTALARRRRESLRGGRAVPLDHELARGPGNLAVALGASIDDDGSRLDVAPYSIEPGPLTRQPVRSGLRVGLASPGGSLPFDWRLWVAGEPSVSRYVAHKTVRGERGEALGVDTVAR